MPSAHDRLLKKQGAPPIARVNVSFDPCVVAVIDESVPRFLRSRFLALCAMHMLTTDAGIKQEYMVAIRRVLKGKKR